MMKNNRASIAACEALEGSVRTALDALLADEWEAKRVAAEAEEAAEGRRGGRRVVVPDGVVLLAMDRLVGLVSFVFARRSTALGARVEEVRSDNVGLDLWPGIWGIQSCVIPLGKKGLGNKGAIAIRLMVHGTSVCYINTHLAAKRAKFLARNENYHTVLKKVIFDTGGSTQHSTTAPQSVRQRLHITNIERRRVVHAYRRDSLEYDYSDVHGPNLLARKEKPPALPARIMDSDVCFWSGDLNYRLEPLCPTTRDAIDALGRATARAEAVSDDGGLAKLKARLAARADAAQAVSRRCSRSSGSACCCVALRLSRGTCGAPSLAPCSSPSLLPSALPLSHCVPLPLTLSHPRLSKHTRALETIAVPLL